MKAGSDTEKLKATVEAFCSFLQGLPQSELQDQQWGPKEVLIHFVFWHESCLSQVEHRLAGQSFTLPKGRYSDINAMAVEQNRKYSIEELVHRFRAANEKLCQLAEGEDAGSIMVEMKQGAKPMSLPALISAAEAHIRNHHRELKRRYKSYFSQSKK
jgi:hypothetical protein